MRSLRSRLCAASLFHFVSGCSIAPDIADVTPLDTAAVVRHVECETRIAILQNIAAHIQASEVNYEVAANGDAVFGSTDLMSAMERLRHLSLGDLYRLSQDNPELANYIFAWDTVVIGFNYTFDTTESNNNSGGLNFSFPVGTHTLKLDATSNLDKKRQNKKTFTVIASVANLLQSRACLSPSMVALNRGIAEPSYSPIGPRGIPDKETGANIVRSQVSNPIVPITGSIGMTDVLETFAAVWRYNQGGQSRMTALQARAPTSYGVLPGGLAINMKAPDGDYSQTLSFTTTVKGKINPTIEVSGSNLTKGTLTSEHSRTDKHDLIIVISAPNNQEILESVERSQKLRAANEREIAEIAAGALHRAKAAEKDAAPSINATINFQKQLNALEQFSRRAAD